jgi:hypothetical protein
VYVGIYLHTNLHFHIFHLLLIYVYSHVVSSKNCSFFTSQATLVILFEFLSKKCQNLPSVTRFIVCWFPRPCRSAFRFVWQLRCHASSSSGFLVFRLSILCDVFLFFYCHLSVRTSNLSLCSPTCALWVRNVSVCLLRLNFLGSAWA